MKIFSIFIIISLLAVIKLSAVDFNQSVSSGNVTMSSQVIVPFSTLVWQNNGTKFPDVIMGQNRIFADPKPDLAIFKLSKEADLTVQITVNFNPNSVNGVVLTGHWHWFDTPPSEDFTGWDITTTTFNWYGPQNAGWIGLILDGLDATTATGPGVRTFTCYISGSYTGI